ncbi:MAG: fasciclin domain-containing protein [Cyclobacteriaceae bacterium]|nr:fasciclin domain-containing protein [Cyclobacteriaceae bacterium]
MRIQKSFLAIALSISLIAASCGGGGTTEKTSSVAEAPVGGGQSAVQDDVSQKDVVRVAVGSAAHTTLVTALKTAEYVDVLSNAGPFTVFAPTNDAFNLLPAGTVEGLLKPESKEALRNILEYHVAVGVYKLENLKDGQTINQVNLDNVTIGVKDGKYTVNGANIVGTVPASNGVVYVVDAVLLPPAKK